MTYDQIPPGPAYTRSAVAAMARAVDAEHDFPGWLADVLARIAAHAGSADALTAGRPGSWEAALVEQLVKGTVGYGDDEHLPDSDGLDDHDRPGPADMKAAVLVTLAILDSADLKTAHEAADRAGSCPDLRCRGRDLVRDHARLHDGRGHGIHVRAGAPSAARRGRRHPAGAGQRAELAVYWPCWSRPCSSRTRPGNPDRRVTRPEPRPGSPADRAPWRRPGFRAPERPRHDHTADVDHRLVPGDAAPPPGRPSTEHARLGVAVQRHRPDAVPDEPQCGRVPHREARPPGLARRGRGHPGHRPRRRRRHCGGLQARLDRAAEQRGLHRRLGEHDRPVRRPAPRFGVDRAGQGRALRHRLAGTARGGGRRACLPRARTWPPR